MFENQVKQSCNLFGEYVLPQQKKGQSERGNLLSYFSQKTGWAIPRLTYKLQGLSVSDYYYIKSVCDKYELEGKGAWGKCFNGMLKHEPQKNI